MTFGQAIKAKRESLGMTQQDLAERLFVSRQTVCRWENGSRCPDLIMSKKISMVLGISMDELVPGEDLSVYAPEKESGLDISCVKVMLSGIMVLLVGIFLLIADAGNMDFSAWCFFGGIGTFVVGLLIPRIRENPLWTILCLKENAPNAARSMILIIRSVHSVDLTIQDANENPGCGAARIDFYLPQKSFATSTMWLAHRPKASRTS